MSSFGVDSFEVIEGISKNVSCFGNPVVCVIGFCLSPYNVSLSRGSYKFELWGGSGGDHFSGRGTGYGGKGGYSSGILNVETSQTLFFYIGGCGHSKTSYDGLYGIGGWNGGGSSTNPTNYVGGGGGGGSSDICTVYSPVSFIDNKYVRNQESYRSRIIVAGGGGGGFGVKYSWANFRSNSYGGSGGGFEGQGSGYGYTIGCSSICDIYNQGDTYSGAYGYVTGATQTSSGSKGNIQESSNYLLQACEIGSFGYGGSSISGNPSGGGGGGGWFGGVGGTSGSNPWGTGGSGGSGYVHDGTNSHSSLSSSYILENVSSLSGTESFPSLNIDNETGHSGNGAARITQLSSVYMSTLQHHYYTNKFDFCSLSIFTNINIALTIISFLEPLYSTSIQVIF